MGQYSTPPSQIEVLTIDPLRRFIRRLSVPGANQAVTLYGKPGCHLCDEAKIALERLRMRYPTVIEEVDITRDPALFRLYDIRIPVLEIGDITLEAPIRDAELRQALAAAKKRPAARAPNRSS